ncbi:DUF2284 domain-containing protein [Eubacteriaceae bacterium ES3]|nr:DUF2284 domain-containing protein [Eubacteriaceae bacterium ES3]
MKMMELKNKLSFGAISIDRLMEEYFDRDKTLGFCKACPNYSKIWSCPPYQFDEELFLKQFKYMHIIGRQYEVPRNDIRLIRDPKAISDYCTEKMEAIKVMTWQTLLEIENEVEGVMGLIPGSCPVCQVQGMECARKSGQPCRFPKLMRFSLESLGFNVVDLVKYEVGMSTKWPENQRLPEILTSVSAILCNEEIPKEVLKKYFPDKKKSWERKNPLMAQKEFHTSEKIMPSETLHGTAQASKAINRIIDEEIPPYQPQKSWVGFKAEREEGEPPMKKGWTVTIQGEEAEKPEVELPAEVVEELTTKAEIPEVAEEITEVVEEVEIVEANPIVEEEDDSKYKWLGFKGNVDDFDEMPKRPIPKMSELILEGDDPESETEKEAALEPEVVEPSDEPAVAIEQTTIESVVSEPATEEKIVESVVEKAAAPEEVKVVRKTAPSLEKTISDLVKAAATGETIKTETSEMESPKAVETPVEEDDSKYKWLGFKGKVDEDEEKIVTKSSLASLVIEE